MIFFCAKFNNKLFALEKMEGLKHFILGCMFL